MMAPLSALTEPFISILATRRFAAFCMHRFKPKFEDCRSRRFSLSHAVVGVSPFAFAMRTGDIRCLSCTLIRPDPAASLGVDHCRLGFTILGRGLPCLRIFARVYLRGVSPGQ